MVAVVGTLLALLVFFALFGIFLTQYVPLWMTDNESQFTSQAATSFAEFKANVDNQYSLNGPPTYGSSFTLSSQGVPLIAQPTEGTLLFLPTTCPQGFVTVRSTGAVPGQPINPGFCAFQNITLSSGPGGSGLYSQHIANGILEMVLPNRYYSAETFYFEDDAVVQSQGGPQQIMALPPPFTVSTVAGNTTVSSSFLQLVGNATTVIGQGSEQVYSHLRYSQKIASNGTAIGTNPRLLNVTFEIGTQYPCAWATYLSSVMNASGVPVYQTGLKYPASFYSWDSPINGQPTVPVAHSACISSRTTTVVALTITDVNYATLFYAGAQVTVGIGGT